VNYSQFAKLRGPSCDAFAEQLERARQHPKRLGYEELEELAYGYRQLLHDHALARARYPGTALARRLRRVALDGTHWLQRDSASRMPNLGRFFSHSFPLALRAALPRIGLALVLFLLAGLSGFALSVMQPSLGTSFLGAEAIEGLKQGSLWTESLFAVVPGSVASTMIATNNLSVALTAWAGGILAGLGSLYAIFLNGVMLGSVIGVTMHYSMEPALFEFISAHGPLEISLILFSAAAGLDLGRALVVADDRPRAERLVQAGRRSLILLLGCLPWILLLGFIEGHISPSSQISWATKIAIGLMVEALFLTLAWNPFLKIAPLKERIG